MPALSQASKGVVRVLRRVSRWTSNNEIQLLRSVRLEIHHRMIDAEDDLLLREMRANERALTEQVERNRPAGRLRVTITLAVVLPEVAPVIALAPRYRHRASDERWT